MLAPSLRRRMACWLYEGMLLFGVVFVSGFVFSVLTQTRHALSHRHAHQIFLFVVIAAYFIWCWRRGQTLAMKTWQIGVVDRHGLPLTRSRALLRYVLSWIWFLPPLAVMAPFALSTGEIALLMTGWVLVWALLSRFRADRQFWHDAWAGTRLVHSRPAKPDVST